MSENQDKIDELLKKLDLLISQQDSFSKEIDSLKSEINAINPNPQKESAITKATESNLIHETEKLNEPKPQIIAKVFPNSTNRISWLAENPIDTIQDEGITLQNKTTAKGTNYASFQLKFEGAEYEMCFLSKGKWFLRNVEEKSLLHGLFKNAGTSLQIGSGRHKDSVIQSDSIIVNTRKMLSLCKVDISKAENAPIQKAVKKIKEKSDIEKYIGENLITVIGIIILFIGVVFGVKYGIDHNLINPLTRIILGYLLGISILLVGFKLKKKYNYFSAVLVSGAIAIMYFDTFIAYSLYDIFPQLVAFGLMIFFTIFTVVAAISYNRQIIAHIALVGSYAIPFLLSNGSGNFLALFSYMAIVNAGILIIGIKKDWKPLYYVAFGATWIIFGAWYLDLYETALHFKIGMGFALLFFILFYATFLGYKLIKKEQFVKSDIVLIVLNSTVFYALCFNMLDRHTIGTHYLGIFTLATACVHFIVSVILFKTKLADRNLFYLSSGMVLAFLTIAIPVQLEGTWITLLWGVEALVLFWIGRTKNVTIYEYLSYPIMFIAMCGLAVDWMDYYAYNSSIVLTQRPFMNVTFLTSLIVCLSFSTILFINMQSKHGEGIRTKNEGILKVFTALLTVVVIGIVYATFRLELDLFWNRAYFLSQVMVGGEESGYPIYNDDMHNFRGVWAIIYTLLFCTVLLFLNSKKFKNRAVGIASIALSVLTLMLFLTMGLSELSELKHAFKYDSSDIYFSHGTMNIALRYISYGFVLLLMLKLYKSVKDEFLALDLKIYFDLFTHLVILWVLCAELIHILDLAGSGEQHKLGLSILVGLYAIVMVAIGIAKKRAYLRIAAFVVFGIVLLKLFFYDIAHLSTIAKTIVFISLGVILLIISFMYNKYKHTFTNEK